MASTLSNQEMRNIARRLKDDEYSSTDGNASVEGRVRALERKVDDLTTLVVELVGRLLP